MKSMNSDTSSASTNADFNIYIRNAAIVTLFVLIFYKFNKALELIDRDFLLFHKRRYRTEVRAAEVTAYHIAERALAILALANRCIVTVSVAECLVCNVTFRLKATHNSGDSVEAEFVLS